MKAHKGDRIILAAAHTDQPTRDGEVLEVRGLDGEPPYLVRWSDGHRGLMYPGPGAVLWVGPEEDHTPSTGRDTPKSSSGRSKEARVESLAPHVKEWQVRVSIFESGDDTSASVVLVSEAPTHLTARGQSRVHPSDTPVPENGHEVAVARALRHLADQLLETAALDIEAVSGEVAHILPV